MSKTITKIDLLIVGGGPVGLMCALEAMRMGATSVRIVDMALKPMDLCKASTVWPRTLELLKYAHPTVYADMEEYANKVATFTIYRGKGNQQKPDLMAKLELEGKFQSEVKTAFCLEQFMTERFLRKDLEKRFHVSVEQGISVTHFQDFGSYVHVELKNMNNDGDTEIVHAKYIVGCDGAHSFTRRNLNLHYPGEAFDQVFLISHCKIDGLPFQNDEIWTVLSESGMAFAVPMPNDTWEFIMNLTPEQSKELFGSDKPRDPTVEELNLLIADRVPGMPPNRIHSPQWIGHFRVNSRQVEKYSVGRVYMCGDACHIHSPVGGQGMNFGMQDACNIGWKLGMVLKGTITPQLLNSYHLERWPIGRLLVTGIETQTKMIMSSNKAVRQMQFLLLPIVGNHLVSSLAASKVAPVAGETIYSYRDSPLSNEHWRFESLSNAFFKMFFSFDPGRVLQRRRTGITRYVTKRMCAGDRVPDVMLSNSFGKENASEPNNLFQRQSTSKWRLLFGGGFPAGKSHHDLGNDLKSSRAMNHDTSERYDNFPQKDVRGFEQLKTITVHSLCSAAGLTALLFEASPGYADASFGHGGQEVDLQQVAWKLETLTHGLVKAHVIGPGELDAQHKFSVAGQCMYLIRPDGYIAFRSQPVDVNKTIHYLRSTMGVKELFQADMALEERVSHRHELELETVTRMLGVAITLLVANIGVTWYTRAS